MTRNEDDRKEALPEAIRRQFGSAVTTRFLNAQPAFRADAELPQHFHHLLDRLDQAEHAHRRGPSGRIP